MREKVIKSGIMAYLILVAAALGACGGGKEEQRKKRVEEAAEEAEDAMEETEDVTIDFDELREINPDIFAWLYIPDTEIDHPVLQSGQSDTFYESHNAEGKEDNTGAVYIELANLTSMCDFNTLLHGKTGSDKPGLFADLSFFAAPDFFTDFLFAAIQKTPFRIK
ncbi:MAG: hypothetical protein K2N43_01430, partial [Lachnospiraceae bacterium]|nr:hypothetical protein [Lachnospiraceae bacterium]